MKKVTLLALLALLVPWLSQSKMYKTKESSIDRNPQVKKLEPGVHGFANARVFGQTTALMILILLLIGTENFAQYSAMSISSGISIGKTKFPAQPNLKSKPLGGFDGGIGAEFGVSKNFSVQAEINFTTTGILLADDTTGAFAKFRNSYLTIPLLAKLYLRPGFSIFGGPHFGYILYGRYVANSTENDIKLNVTHGYKSFDLCAVAGMEYRFPVGVFVNLRYQYGIAQIDKLTFGNDDEPLKNRYFTFRLGYSLPFTKLMKSN